MKALRNAVLIRLIAFVLAPARAEDSAATNNDMALLQGEWSMVSGSANGQPMPDETRKQMKRVCNGNEATTAMSGQV